MSDDVPSRARDDATRAAAPGWVGHGSAPQWSSDGSDGSDGSHGSDGAADAVRPSHARDGAPGSPRPAPRRYGAGPMLGAGGMGRVVLGHDPVLGRALAVKEALTPDAAPRLRREARILASLDHPSIVAIYDADLSVPWFAMRLVPGRTWAAALAERPALADRLGLMRQLLAACEGVAHAHQRGVVHRDLKPDNVLIDDLGATQVLDWGLAALVEPTSAAVVVEPALAATPANEADVLGLGAETQHGAVLGTPAYLSPEAARGEALDRRADVWALGLLLWQTLTALPPWAGHDVATILARLRAGESPLDATVLPDAPRAALPPELVAIARRATAIDRDARYPDARALAADLGRWLDGRRVHAHTYSQRELVMRALRTLRLPLIVAAVAVVAIAVVVGASTLQVRAERDRAQAALGESQRAQSALWAAQAVTSLAAGAGPEAEQAALAALTVGDGPRVDDAADARGVLAATRAEPRATLLDARSIDGCSRLIVAEGGGDVLCVEAEATSFWPAGARAARWRRPGTIQAAAWARGGERLVLQTSNYELVVVGAADGGQQGSLRQGGGPQPLVLVQGVVAQAIGSEVTRIRLQDGASLPRWAGCDGPISAIALTATATGTPTLWAACADGRVVGQDGITVVRTPLHAPVADITALARDEQGAFWLASSKGHLLRVDPATAAGKALPDDTALPGDTALPRPLGSMVRELRLVPGGHAALRGDRGEVRVVDLHALDEGVHRPAAAASFALPGVAHGELTLDGDGVLWSGGAQVRRWRLAATADATTERTGRLLVAPGDRSVTSVCLLADERGVDVVLATGDGLVERLRAPPGRHAYAARWQTQLPVGVVKAIACDATAGRVWVGTMTFDGVLGLDAATGHRVAAERLVRPARRLVALPGGRWLAATFEAGIWFGGGPDDDVPLPIGATTLDWVDLDGDGGEVCAVGSGPGRVVAVDVTGRVGALRELLHLPGARACAPAGAGRVVLAREDRLQLHAPGAGPWSVALPARPADLARDGDDVAVALLNGETQIHRLGDGLLLARLRGHQERVASLAFHSGQRPALWSASWDGSLLRWQPGAWR